MIGIARVTDLGYQPIEPPTHKLAKNRDLVSIDSIQLVGHSEAMHSICDYERGFIPHAYIPYPPSAAERPVPRFWQPHWSSRPQISPEPTQNKSPAHPTVTAVHQPRAIVKSGKSSRSPNGALAKAYRNF